MIWLAKFKLKNGSDDSGGGRALLFIATSIAIASIG
jgi:hypothetical protein